MAEGNLKVDIDVNALFQKELVKVIQTLFDDHGITVISVDIDWARMSDGTSRIAHCETRTGFIP